MLIWYKGGWLIIPCPIENLGRKFIFPSALGDTGPGDLSLPQKLLRAGSRLRRDYCLRARLSPITCLTLVGLYVCGTVFDPWSRTSCAGPECGVPGPTARTQSAARAAVLLLQSLLIRQNVATATHATAGVDVQIKGDGRPGRPDAAAYPKATDKLAMPPLITQLPVVSGGTILICRCDPHYASLQRAEKSKR